MSKTKFFRGPQIKLFDIVLMLIYEYVDPIIYLNYVERDEWCS